MIVFHTLPDENATLILPVINDESAELLKNTTENGGDYLDEGIRCPILSYINIFMLFLECFIKITKSIL